MTNFSELQEELRSVLSGRGSRILDSLLPLLVFLIVNSFLKLEIALWSSFGIAVVISIYRIVKKENLVYALGGLGALALAALFVNLSNSGAGFFLPGLISGAVTVILCIVSVMLNKPLVAWTSFIARRWPLEWYWHPQVLPAYNEVTIAWGVVFSGRLLLEWWLFQSNNVEALGAVRIVLGWPLTIGLLIASYLYGLWRLGHLGGPSVKEFTENKRPPYTGQKRGF